MKIRTRLTLWYAGMLLGSLLLMGAVLHYELVGEFEAGKRPESPREKIEDILTFYGLPTLVILVLGGSWVIRRALRPVEQLADGVERVHAGNLAARVPRTGTGDELDRLAAAFNAMLARIEAGTASVRDFAFHASHELKTPLTILNVETELALSSSTLTPAEQARLTSQSEELRRLGRLVDTLSLFAKADAGLAVVAPETVDLGALVGQAADDAQILAREANVSVAMTRCDPAKLRGDPAALRQVLLNLLDNAIKHNRPNGWVRVALQATPAELTILVDNSGAPISADLAPRLFQRFARGSTTAAGSGLGLSLAKAIVEAHHGTLAYEPLSSESVRFQVRLPLNP